MNQRYRLPLLCLLLAVLASSCATSSISMEILQPADITLPNDIQTLGLVSRFKPEKGKGFLNVLEGALSGEGIGQDRNGAEASLAGLTQSLAGSPRFRILRPATELEGWGRATFPTPLPARTVSDICARYNTDALVTIEAFDSDEGRSCERRTRVVKRDGEKFTEVFFEAEQWIDVTVGWRLYSRDGRLLDEFRMRERVRFDAEGPNETAAFRALPNTSFMVQEMGRVTGNAYSMRIAPIFVNVHRSYYSGGTTALKLGRNKVRAGDWEGAEKHWRIAEKNEKEKIRGRAVFNQALAAEVRGDLEGAHRLASQAYEQYGNKRARRYAETLRFRIHEVDRLDEQMQGAPQ